MQMICCVCHKTKRQNRWIKQLVAQRADLSHGYCPQCYKQVIKKIKNHRPRLNYQHST